MSLTKLLKKVMIEMEVTQSELAHLSGQSQQNLSNKMLKDNFTIKEFEKLIHALGCTLEINVYSPNGKRI